MKLFFNLAILCPVAFILAGCAHFQSAQNASFDQNQCINLKREMMMTNHQYGSQEISQIRVRQMQLHSQYQKLNCDEVLYSARSIPKPQ